LIQLSWSAEEAEALEQCKFRLAGDPRTEWKVASGKFPSEDFEGIVQYYRYDLVKLPCCLCGFARHYDGAVVASKHGTFHLMGNCCGLKHFGDQWQESTKTFRSQEKFIEHRTRSRSILADEESILNAARSLREPIKHICRARKTLFNLFGNAELKRLADELRRHGGKLTSEVELSDEFKLQGTSGALRSTIVETERLVGWEIFLPKNWDRFVEDVIGRVTANLSEIRDGLDRGYSTFAKIKKTNDHLDEILKAYEVVDRFIGYNEAKNALIIQEWYQRKGIRLALTANGKTWSMRTNVGKTSSDLADIVPARISASFKEILAKRY
jgi:hypothetical protein